MKIAILLSTNSFEDFFVKKLGLSHTTYIESYRNDFSWDYTSGLAKQGVNASIYIPSVKHSESHQTGDGFSVRFLPISAWYWPWLKLPLLSKTPIGRYISEVMHTAAIYQALRRSLAADGIDLLYVQEYWTGRFDFLAVRLDVPVMGADHGGSSYRQLKWFKRRAFRATKITVQTPDELAEVTQYGADATLLTNGVDTEFYTPAPDPVKPQKTILIVARLENKQKRISDLIYALTHLAPEWRLNIVGNGPDRSAYQSLVAKLNLTERVTFSGFVADRTQVRGLLRECGVFVLPSATEGLALVVLEAMSCGAAVVVTNIRAFENVIEDKRNGIKVEVGDIKGIAEGITAAFEHRQELGKEARKTVLNCFSQKSMSEQLALLINQCVQAGQPKT